MKTIGLIGGTTWVSTQDYYRYFNELVNARLGGSHSAKCIIFSIDYGEASAARDRGDWGRVLEMLVEGARALELGGAACVLLGANTLHKNAAALQEKTSLPLIHIGTVTANAILKKGLKKVALLGTKFTMEDTFISSKLEEAGLEVLIPNAEERTYIHESIMTELGKNIFREETRAAYLRIMNRLTEEGAEGVILGCTEIPVLIKPEHTALITFDTTFLHAEAAVDFILSE